MQALDQVQFLVLALLPDGAAPLSIVLPEVRRLMPSAETDDVFRAVRSLSDSGFVHIQVCELTGRRRLPSEADYMLIQSEYSNGIRDAALTRQIMDRNDLW